MSKEIYEVTDLDTMNRKLYKFLITFIKEAGLVESSVRMKFGKTDKKYIVIGKYKIEKKELI